MTREEYEDRRRRLDEQLRAGFELLEAAHRQQVRALDLVWMTTAEEAVSIPRFPAEASSGPEAQPTAAPAQDPPSGSPPRPAPRSAWRLQGDVEAALANVPDVFDRNDLCRTLGYEPDRASLYRTIWELIGKGVLALEDRGSGRTPSRYRKTGAATAKADA
jgi:hypothetical protein